MGNGSSAKWLRLIRWLAFFPVGYLLGSFVTFVVSVVAQMSLSAPIFLVEFWFWDPSDVSVLDKAIARLIAGASSGYATVYLGSMIAPSHRKRIPALILATPFVLMLPLSITLRSQEILVVMDRLCTVAAMIAAVAHAFRGSFDPRPPTEPEQGRNLDR